MGNYIWLKWVKVHYHLLTLIPPFATIVVCSLNLLIHFQDGEFCVFSVLIHCTDNCFLSVSKLHFLSFWAIIFFYLCTCIPNHFIPHWFEKVSTLNKHSVTEFPARPSDQCTPAFVTSNFAQRGCFMKIVRRQ